jgi:hypothetical protein
MDAGVPSIKEQRVRRYDHTPRDDHTPRAAGGTIQGNKRPASSTDGADRGPACSVSAAVVFRSSFGRVVHYEWSDGGLSVRGVARDAALMSVGHPGNHVGTHDRHVACDAVELELRRNRMRAGCIDEFLDAWLRGVVPLRRRFGFTVLGAWVVEDADELVWILGYDGSDGFADADRRYYASPERVALDPDPAQWFMSSECVRLRQVLEPD